MTKLMDSFCSVFYGHNIYCVNAVPTAVLRSVGGQACRLQSGLRAFKRGSNTRVAARSKSEATLRPCWSTLMIKCECTSVCHPRCSFTHSHTVLTLSGLWWSIATGTAEVSLFSFRLACRDVKKCHCSDSRTCHTGPAYLRAVQPMKPQGER